MSSLLCSSTIYSNSSLPLWPAVEDRLLLPLGVQHGNSQKYTAWPLIRILLYQPTKISALEAVARHFTAQVDGLQDMDYWDRLHVLHLYSQERRRERYQIIFIWKVLQGLVQGYTLNTFENSRRGRLVEVPPYKSKAPAAVRKAKESSLVV